MKSTHLALVLLSVGIVMGASYYSIATSPGPPPLINSPQLSSVTNMSWVLTSTSKINKIMNVSIREGGFNSGIQGNFELKNNTSTTLSVNVIRYENPTDANKTYINLTNSLFKGFSSNFPYNSTVSNGIIYDLLIQPKNVSDGTGSTINYTTLIAVHKNLFVAIMESGISFPPASSIGILNWEVNANSA
jgi:hypothetical protein